MMTKKSQMEILGLSIVVVLVLVAVVFAARFLIFKTPSSYRAGFISSELASNMLSTFLKTNAKDCSRLSMTELLQDCGQSLGGGIRCHNGGDEKSSCKFLESTAQEIFDKTFKKWGVNYEFLAYTDRNDPNTILVRSGDKCMSEKKSKVFPIPISTCTMFSQLDICG